MIVIERAQDWHAVAIGANARPADVDELWAIGRCTPVEAMRAGMKLSRAETALCDGVPVAMFGVTPLSLLLGRGVPWMVGSSLLDTMPLRRALLREAVGVLRGWQDRYSFLLNFVDERNVSAQRWLRWLGFTLGDDPQPMGADGAPFRMFYWRRDHVCSGDPDGGIDGDDGHWWLPASASGARCWQR